MSSAFVKTLEDPVIVAIPFFILFMTLEIVALNRLDEDEKARYKGYERRDSRASILMGLGSLFVNGGARVVALVGYAALYAISPLSLDPHQWWVWVYAVLVVDLLFYTEHRAAHRVRILWAAHQAHHNSQTFNLSTAVRQKWNPWWELIVWTPLPLLGMPPWMIFTAFSINLLFQYWVHTERIDRMPKWFELILNTPSHHRVHHSSDKAYIDKNYAGILIVWDRIFGTYVEETFRPTYGLTKNIDSYNPFKLQYHEYANIFRDVRNATRLRDKLGYVFGPPGWEPKQPTTAPGSAPVPEPVAA
jgi:sterol desaturase/sphingolipid hydroxylase (fatty acid hydroxylase superfamily)